MQDEIKRLERRPTWELKAMSKALSLHSWHNTPEKNVRLAAAKEVLSSRRK